MKSQKNTPPTAAAQAPWWARLGSLTQRAGLQAPVAQDFSPQLAPHLQSGLAAEDAAAALVQAAGLKILGRNYKTPGRGGGEIDLIAQEGSTLVFIEVRQRKHPGYGGAAGSISATKQARWRYAAQVYLQQFGSQLPDCRFDAILFEGENAPQWLRGVMQ